MAGPRNAEVNDTGGGEQESFLDDVLANDSDDYEGEAPDTDDGGEEEATVSPSGRQEAEPELPLEAPSTARVPDTGTVGLRGDPDNPKGFQRVGHLFADKQGNIVTKDGRVIAAKGEAARHWVDMSRRVGQAANIQRQNEVLTRKIQQNERLVQQAKEIAELPSKMGLSEADFNEGMNLMRNWTRDPVGVARDIVGRTMALGHNITDIVGKTAGDAVDMNALRHLVNEITAPTRRRDAEEQITVQNRNRVNEAYDAFVSRYPDALVHDAAIGNLMTTHGLTPVEAYHEVKHFALRYGLDFSQPLGPQIAAAQARANGNGNGQRPTTHRAPMTAGAGGGNRSNLATETPLADANSSWSDILNSVMRETQ